MFLDEVIAVILAENRHAGRRQSAANCATMKRSQSLVALAAPLLAPSIASAQRGAPFQIGCTYPLTGPLANVGNELLEGGKLAADEINRAGGVRGRRIELVVEDTAGTPQGGVASMRKLVQVNGVKAIMNIYTNVVTAQIPLAEELRVTCISTVESPGLFEKTRYSFSHATNWGQTLPKVIAYWKAHGTKRVYGLFGNNALGQLQTAALRPAVVEMGGEYNDALLDPNGTDFRGVIDRVKDAKPQVVIITGQGASYEAVAIKQVRELGLRTPIWSFGQSFTSKYFHDAIGPYAEGMVFGGLYLDPKVSPRFMHAYRDRMGYLPAYNAGENYDVIKMFAFAIGKAGYDGDGIRDVIATLKNFPTVLGGTLYMAPDHFTRASSVGLWLVKQGSLVPLTG
jgi:branched-chain amino acid transport system substrate-binding protein